jgi:hypothetical protein
VGFCAFTSGTAFSAVFTTGTAFSTVFAFGLATLVGVALVAFAAFAGVAFAGVGLTVAVFATFFAPTASFFPTAAAFVLAFLTPPAPSAIPSPSTSATTFFGRPRFLGGSVVAAASMFPNWLAKISRFLGIR